MKLKVLLILVGLCVLASGCKIVEEPVNLSSMPPGPEPVRQNQGGVSGPNQVSAQDSMQAALVWAEKYEKLVTHTEELEKQNEKITQDNEKLAVQIETQQKELLKTQKELKEANEVLLDMRVELGNWKKDVLGFREEMRQSQQALMAASAKILRELGAEIRDPMPQDATAAVEK